MLLAHLQEIAREGYGIDEIIAPPVGAFMIWQGFDLDTDLDTDPVGHAPAANSQRVSNLKYIYQISTSNEI